MTKHNTGTRHEWEASRRALLEREKELTRLSDELAAERAALPWVPVETEYTFDTEEGTKTLAELFGSNSQLIVYHFMFGPDWEEGCKSCSAVLDHIEIPRVHLEHHDVSFVAVSRAPLDKLLGYRSRMGWSIPWVSSFGSDFNFDFQVSSTDERPLREYNFRAVPRRGASGPPERAAGDEQLRPARRPGVPHLLGLRPRARRDAGHVPVVRPRSARPQRARRRDGLVAPPRRLRGDGVVIAHVAGVPVEELLPLALVSGAGLVAATRTWFSEAVRRRRRSP